MLALPYGTCAQQQFRNWVHHGLPSQFLADATENKPVLNSFQTHQNMDIKVGAVFKTSGEKVLAYLQFAHQFTEFEYFSFVAVHFELKDCVYCGNGKPGIYLRVREQLNED